MTQTLIIMPQSSRFLSLLMVSSALAFGSTACSNLGNVSQNPAVSPESVAIATPSPVPTSPAPATEPSPIAAQPDPYNQAIDRASSAFRISQSAQSQDDWQLVANRWQQAIDLMAAVPTSSPNHAEAQSKLSEYRRNLTYAQQQVNRPIDSSPSVARVVPATPSTAEVPSTASTATPSRSGDRRVFQAPIVRRSGGTPIIQVTFNGGSTFEMIVDTGASGTLITQRMAAALNVVPVGQATVDTASARGVSFPLGYVRSIEVDGAVAQNVLVAVAGPELDVGLLGHDFFGNYDVTIRQNMVEFRER